MAYDLPPDLQWTGREATALRQAMRLTYEQFADRFDVSPRSVAHWAARPEIVPRPGTRRLLEDVLLNAPDHIQARFDALIGREPKREKLSVDERREVAALLRTVSDRIDSINRRIDALTRPPAEAVPA